MHYSHCPQMSTFQQGENTVQVEGSVIKAKYRAGAQ